MRIFSNPCDPGVFEPSLNLDFFFHRRVTKQRTDTSNFLKPALSVDMKNLRVLVDRSGHRFIDNVWNRHHGVTAERTQAGLEPHESAMEAVDPLPDKPFFHEQRVNTFFQGDWKGFCKLLSFCICSRVIIISVLLI